jgi:hypothetical protein
VKQTDMAFGANAQLRNEPGVGAVATGMRSLTGERA